MRSTPQGRAMVFAPAPDLTVTLECLADRDELHLHAGGQGFWIARLLHVLGVPTTLCASFGGETGTVVRALIEREGIDLIGVEVGGDNGGYVHDRRSGERIELGVHRPTPLSRHDIDDLYATALAAGLASTVAVLGGPRPEAAVLPMDTYRRLASDLRTNGTLVVADLSGEAMHAVLDGGVDVLKTSDEDLAADGLLAPEASAEEVVAAMGKLTEQGEGAGHVLVTRGHRPALALSRDGQLLAADGPHFEPVDTRGAGDSTTAGVAAGLARGMPFADALRLGVAAAVLNVARRGLASGHPEAIAAIVDRVSVTDGRDLGARLD